MEWTWGWEGSVPEEGGMITANTKLCKFRNLILPNQPSFDSARFLNTEKHGS